MYSKNSYLQISDELSEKETFVHVLSHIVNGVADVEVVVDGEIVISTMNFIGLKNLVKYLDRASSKVITKGEFLFEKLKVKETLRLKLVENGLMVDVKYFTTYKGWPIKGLAVKGAEYKRYKEENYRFYSEWYGDHSVIGYLEQFNEVKNG